MREVRETAPSLASDDESLTSQYHRLLSVTS